MIVIKVVFKVMRTIVPKMAHGLNHAVGVLGDEGFP